MNCREENINNPAWVLDDEGVLHINENAEYYTRESPAPWYSLRGRIKRLLFPMPSQK